MLEGLEWVMAWARRLKLYLTIGSAVAAALAIAIVRITEHLLIGLSRAGDTFTERLLQNEIAALAVFIGIGYTIYSKWSDKPIGFDVPIAFASFMIGVLAVCVFFWLLPALAHAIAVNLLSPLLIQLSAFLKGDAAISLALFVKILFGIYFASFVVDALIERFLHRRDVGPMIQRMLTKYGKELIDVLHDILELVLLLPKLLWGRRSSPPE